MKISLTSKVIGFFKGLPSELVERVRTREPLPFYWVEKNDQGGYVCKSNDRSFQTEEVGEPQQVHHLTFHDMMAHAVTMDLTEKVLTQGLEVNAIYIDRDKFERMGGGSAVTTYQPLKLSFEDLSPEQISDKIQYVLSGKEALQFLDTLSRKEYSAWFSVALEKAGKAMAELNQESIAQGKGCLYERYDLEHP